MFRQGMSRFGEGVARRCAVIMMMLLAVALLMVPATPVAAQDEVDSLPPINEFASARFDLLTTLRFGEEQISTYGQGSTILPDRVAVWVSADDGTIVYVVQIGTVVYINDGTTWERTDTPPTDVEPVTVGDQLAELNDTANSILRVGDAVVRDVPTTHYQVWITGSRLLEAEGDLGLPEEERELIEQSFVKYDLWIGQEDGFLHQQNVVVSFPEMEIDGEMLPITEVSTLTTYYNFNDPTISIEAPI